MVKAVGKRPAAAVPCAATASRALRSPLGRPIPRYDAKCSLAKLRKEANRVGFDAKAYVDSGYCVLRALWSEQEIEAALAAARRVRAGSKGSNNQGEFVFLRGSSSPDKLLLFSLLNRYVPFLHQLLGGIMLPGSNGSPYGHHNQLQLAVKVSGFEGYAELNRMASSRVGHIDQSSARQTPPGRPTSNYSLLLGVVLAGETKRRGDAGNLFLAPGSYKKLAEAFRATEGDVLWYPNITEHYLGPVDPEMQAVRAGAGEVILMHHQTVHGVGPNHSDTDRVNVYFRITASGRPEGSRVSYPQAMREPLLETPRLTALARS